MVGLHVGYNLGREKKMIQSGQKYDFVILEVKEAQCKIHKKEAQKKSMVALLAAMRYTDLNLLLFYKRFLVSDTMDVNGNVSDFYVE